MNMLSEQEATQIALDTLRGKGIPFREKNISSKLVTQTNIDDIQCSFWRISLDIPMPLGMQDEYFTVKIDATSGVVSSITTPTGNIA